MALDIKVDNAILDQITETELNAIDGELPPIIEQDAAILRAAAIDFNNELESLNNEINEFKALLKKQKEMRNAYRAGNAYKKIDTYIQGRQQQTKFLKGDIPKRYYAAANKFQNIINEVIGQKVVTIYVYENNGVADLYEIKNNEVLKFDVTSRGYNFVGRYNPNLNDLQNAMSKLSFDDEPFQFNLEGLKNTYRETLFRYRTSRKHNNRIVLWQNPQTVWHHAFISGEGDINEAYATVILQNNRTPSFNNLNIELNIEEFITVILNITNESGMLSGDVTIGNIEYAIKSANASTLGISQLKKLAKEIIADAHFDKQKLLDLKHKLKQKARRRNKEVSLKEEVEKELIAAIQGNGIAIT